MGLIKEEVKWRIGYYVDTVDIRSHMSIIKML